MQLLELDLSSNMITSLDLLPGLRRMFGHLRVLNLSGNGLERVDNLVELLGKGEVNLSHNALERIRLVSANISASRARNDDEIDFGSKSLRINGSQGHRLHLDLSANRLSDLPAVLGVDIGLVSDRRFCSIEGSSLITGSEKKMSKR